MKYSKLLILLLVTTAVLQAQSSINQNNSTQELTIKETTTNQLATAGNSDETRKTISGRYITQSQAEAKVRHYTEVKRRGKRRSIIGGALTLTGIILVASAEKETTTTQYGSETKTNDPAGVVGGVMLLPGIPIMIGGLVQLGVGTSKIEEYSNLFSNSSASIIIGEDKLGLSYTYSF